MMTLVSDQTIVGQEVRLDNHSFVSCKLVNCHITYAGGYFGLHDTTIESPSWSFDGAAQRTIDFLVKFNLDLKAMILPPPVDEIPN